MSGAIPQIPARASAAAIAEARAIAEEIKAHGGSRERWDRADRTPTVSAIVHNLVHGAGCYVTPAWQLEQFRRFGESGIPRGGVVWTRPSKAVAA